MKDHNHDNGHDHAHDDDDDNGVVVLVDPEGNEVHFGFLGFVEDEGLQYVLLSPVEQLEAEDEEFDVFIFQYSELEDGSEEFGEVADKDVFERVSAKANELLMNMGDDEDEDEDEAEADA